MRLGLFINPTGHHQASWRHPEAEPDAGINFDHYRRMTQLAEAAKFDAIFLADNLCVREGPPDFISRVAQYVANFEPITMLSALSTVTTHIGLIATASTSFNPPFHVARKFASLDHLSGGRAGWNIVTSGMEIEALNFNMDEHYDHDFRYGIAKEFVEVVLGLWDSWDDDAFIRDQQSGIFSDAAHKLHTLNHVGEHFKVRGPLNVPRCPQGYPLLVQAGSSEAGKSFAAEYGEMIFTTVRNIEDGREFCQEMRERVEGHGRNPDHIKVMPGLAPVVGRTESEAQEKFEFLQSLLPDEVALHFLKSRLRHVDLSAITLDTLDQPMPDLPPPSSTGTRGTYLGIKELIERQRPTVRQLARQLAGSLAGIPVHGSAEQLADLMEEWFTAGACDGFNIQPAYMPGAFVDFCELVVPELRRRGLVRSDYDGKTLREHFGLPRPQSRYARVRETAPA
jgi:alkanesulfonate monooxygenase